MSHFQRIYQTQAIRYDALVSREDYQGNILRQLQAIAPLDGTTVVEVGAGTGRLSLLVAPHVRKLFVSDASKHMLSIAVQKLQDNDHVNWHAFVADSQELPTRNNIADISLAGWCFGHATEWFAGDWQTHIDRSVNDMLRVLHPGGMAIILETMGTGTVIPAPPNESLTAYYHRLETWHGFQATTLRTDYQFTSLDEAERLTRFFFGDDLANRVRDEHLVILPECTGVWWKQV
jgi:ubiquinone/menaquinone biosynthesis C-methylase UbiE